MKRSLIRFDEHGAFCIAEPGLLEAIAGGLGPNTVKVEPGRETYERTGHYYFEETFGASVNQVCSGENGLDIAINSNCDINNPNCMAVVNGACGANGGCPNVGCL